MKKKANLTMPAKKRKKTVQEKACRHKWIRLVAKQGKKYIAAPVWVCTRCGTLRVGTHTIRISRYRLDMGNKPIYNASEVHGTVYYS